MRPWRPEPRPPRHLAKVTTREKMYTSRLQKHKVKVKVGREAGNTVPSCYSRPRLLWFNAAGSFGTLSSPRALSRPQPVSSSPRTSRILNFPQTPSSFLTFPSIACLSHRRCVPSTCFPSRWFLPIPFCLHLPTPLAAKPSPPLSQPPMTLDLFSTCV